MFTNGFYCAWCAPARVCMCILTPGRASPLPRSGWEVCANPRSSAGRRHALSEVCTRRAGGESSPAAYSDHSLTVLWCFPSEKSGGERLGGGYEKVLNIIIASILCKVLCGRFRIVFLLYTVYISVKRQRKRRKK